MNIDVEKFLSELEMIVNMDSGQGDPDGITAVGRFFGERLKKLGWIVEECHVGDETGKCIVAKNRLSEHYDALLVGHIDTVFPCGESAKRPFRRDDRRAYGVGVMDMKQGALQMLWTAEGLPKDVSDRLNIVMIFNPDEEIGSIYSKELIDSYAKISSFAYVFEAALPDGARTVCRKGRYSATVRFKGKAGHAGYIFDGHSVSAVNELIYWSHRLLSLCSKETQTGVNIGKISGGEAVNIVADRAQMEFEVRYYSLSELEKLKVLLGELKEHAKGASVELELENERTVPPMSPSQRTLEYEKHIKTLSEKNGIRYTSRPRGGFSDANHISQFCPVCIDGLAPSGDLDHSDREYLDIASIEPSLKFSRLLICDLVNYMGK